MKLILDAHLPSSLAQYFHGHDVVHTSALPEGNLTTDATINQISLLEDRALITKDSDFYNSFVANRQPKKLVLVKLGNMRLKELKAYFERNAVQLISLLEDHSFLILEASKIRVLE
jgi:predicted nuclease of predicted toxin-antitoxin system